LVSKDNISWFDIMENKGYVIGALSFLMILPSILLLMVLMDMLNLDNTSNTMLKSDTAYYITGDIEKNIPPITRQSLNEIIDNTIKTGDPLPNSRIVIKDLIESKMAHINAVYQNQSGLNIKCIITSVDSSSNPFEVEVNSTIVVSKDNITFNRNICQKISILGSYYPKKNSSEPDSSLMIRDPLPFIKCKKFGGLNVNQGKISYGSSLAKYLSRRGIKGADIYENAVSPLFIKRCPYEPYISHGNSRKLMTLKNCIENQFYHESSDGACILCRLEGKSTCNHYGFETFIIPAPSYNQRILRAPCSIDHVIFNDKTFNDTYLGEAVEYYNNGNLSYNIFLDNGHRTKYGVLTV
jgi:hypothetical protein